MTDDITREDVRRVLQRIEAMAGDETNPDVAGGMRRARLTLERELLTHD